MTPDLDLAVEAIGRVPSSWTAVAGGYTRSRAWRAETTGGPVFVKQAEDAGSLAMLRREALVHSHVSGEFLPGFVGFADAGERAVLALELLEGAYWPPPYPTDVTPLLQTLAQVASAEPPAALPLQGRRSSRWRRIADDPEPLLELGVCSREWLDDSLDALVAAEAEASFEGRALVHNDVYSGNVGFVDGRAVLLDWGAAVRGSPWIDLAFALLSLRVEGASPPEVDFPDEGAFAAALAGHCAVGATAPLPAWAPPGSTLREEMAGDLAHALRWASELLDLGLP